MRKAILLPFLLPLVGFAAVKGYFWYQVKRVVDEAVAKVAPFAAVEYRGIETRFDGAAGVTGLKVTPIGLGQTLEIGALRVLAPSWTFFLGAGDRLQQGAIPEQLGFEVEGLVIDFSRPPFSQWEGVEGVQDTLLGCEKANIGGATFLKALGYAQLSTNLKLAYEFNPLSEFLSYQLDLSVDEDDSRFSMRADIDLGIPELSRARLKAVKPRFGGLEVTYQDRKFNQRRNAYCAQANGESVLAFVNRHVALMAARYRDKGLQFDDALVEGYRRFLTGNGEMALSVRAANPIDFQTLALYSPANLIEALDIGVKVNGKAVEPLGLGWQAPAEQGGEALAARGAGAPAAGDQAEAAQGGGEQVAEASEPAASAAPASAEAPSNAVAATPAPAGGPSKTEAFLATAFTPEPVSKPEFRPVTFDRLRRHDGAQVKLITRNGRVIEGQLIVPARGPLRLRQKVGNGVAVLPVVLERLAEVQVLY